MPPETIVNRSPSPARPTAAATRLAKIVSRSLSSAGSLLIVAAKTGAGVKENAKVARKSILSLRRERNFMLGFVLFLKYNRGSRQLFSSIMARAKGAGTGRDFKDWGGRY